MKYQRMENAGHKIVKFISSAFFLSNQQRKTNQKYSTHNKTEKNSKWLLWWK